MRRETISRAVGDINPKYIQEAEGFPERKKTGKRTWIRRISAAACVCAVIAGAGTFAAYRAVHPWPVRYVRMPKESGDTLQAVIPRWDTLPVYEQYQEVEWEGEHYLARSAVIPRERIGEALGEAAARGWDVYAAQEGEDGLREKRAEICAVAGIARECALALRYEGSDVWYALWNTDYRPRTLGQLLEDLNLYEEAVFGSAYYSYRNILGEFADVSFEGIDGEQVRSWLLSQREAKEVYLETELAAHPHKVMDVSVSLPLFGIHNISLAVLEDGYIETNIVSTGAMFYIGEDNTQGFVDYVRKECRGYETVVVYDDRADPEGEKRDGGSGQSEVTASPSVSAAYEGTANP